MSIAAIQAALETQLNNASGLPRIAWENVHFDPGPEEAFIETNFAVTDSRPAYIGPNAQTYTEALFTINISVPINTSTIAANNIVDLLRTYFNTDEDLEYDGTIVRIRRTESKSGMMFKTWYVVPFLIHSYSFHN